MKYTKSLGLGLIGLCLFGMATRASAGILEAGLHFGGDELVRVTYVSGSTASVDAGGLLSFAVGPTFDFGPTLEGRVTIGVKVDSVSASNGDVTFIRYPIDMLLMARTGDWRLGGGLTYHLNPKLDGGGVASGLSADFDDALGVLLSVERDLGAAFFGIRVTFIEYESIPSATVNRVTVDGNSFGIVGGLRF